MRTAGASISTIAAHLAVSERTVQDYLAAQPWRASRRQAQSPELLLEAGLSYLVTFDVAPSARNWNPTLARRDSVATFMRHQLGWIAQQDMGEPEPRIRRWPSPAVVARTFGSFDRFVRAVQRERARRVRAGEPFVPVPLPAEHVALARANGISRDYGGPEWESKLLETLGVGSAAPRPRLDELAEGELPSVVQLNSIATRMAPLDGRVGVAIVGGRGAGRTSLLSSIAVSDVAEGLGEVIVIERTPTIGEVLHAAGANLRDPRWPDEPLLADERAPTVHWLCDEDPRMREIAVSRFAPLVASTDGGVTSLLVDDADDLLEPLIALAECGDRRLVIHAVWNPTGCDTDQRLLDLLPSLSAFRADTYAAAELVANHLNRLNEAVERHPQR